MRAEIAILVELRHKNVVKVLEIIESDTDKKLYIGRCAFFFA